MSSTPLYVEMLTQAFASRRAKNSRYSLRAFARYLKIGHGVLSMILASKRVPSKKFAERVPALLALTPTQSSAFQRSIAEARRLFKLGHLNTAFEGQHPLGKRTVKEVSQRTFESISTWYHPAILELTFVEGFEGNAEWIAKRLGLTKSEANKAVDQLVKVGLLALENSTLVKSDSAITTAQKNETSQALRNRQQEVLELSIESLKRDPIDRRSHSAITMAIDPEKLPDARRMIEEFSRSMGEFLESGRKTEVFELSISLFSLEGRKKE